MMIIPLDLLIIEKFLDYQISSVGYSCLYRACFYVDLEYDIKFYSILLIFVFLKTSINILVDEIQLINNDICQ
jgi:hypothetical protein